MSENNSKRLVKAAGPAQDHKPSADEATSRSKSSSQIRIQERSPGSRLHVTEQRQRPGYGSRIPVHGPGSGSRDRAESGKGLVPVSKGHGPDHDQSHVRDTVRYKCNSVRSNQYSFSHSPFSFSTVESDQSVQSGSVRFQSSPVSRSSQSSPVHA